MMVNLWLATVYYLSTLGDYTVYNKTIEYKPNPRHVIFVIDCMKPVNIALSEIFVNVLI